MRSLLFRLLAAAVVCLSAWGLYRPASSQAPAPPPAIRGTNLVVAVDVSYSMYWKQLPKYVPSDPGGIRWDAVQFLIDTAGPDDRVALLLYRTDAALVSRYLDPSGFVTLGDGPGSPRLKLKQMIEGFKSFEERATNPDADDPGYPIEGHPPLKLGDGTGTLLTVGSLLNEDRTRAKWDLKLGEDGRKTWVMVFTDGMDERPYLNDHRQADGDVMDGNRVAWGKNRLGYLDRIDKEYEPYRDENDPKAPKRARPAEPSAAALSELIDEVVRTAKPFRAAGIPIFTFGLNDRRTTNSFVTKVMRESLSRLSAESLAGKNDLRFARLDLFNEVSNNAELLARLQEISWELREQWLIGPQTFSGRVLLTTPDRRLCEDLGVLLYRRLQVPGGSRAEAPDQTVTGPALAPLTSRSHHYVRIPASVAGGTRVDARFAPGSDAVAVVGLRLKTPTLELKLPEGRPYSPVDAIPIRVAFDAAPDSPLRSNAFQVEAVVRPPKSGPVAIKSFQSRERAGGWDLEAYWVPQDHLAAGAGSDSIQGEWNLDVVVRIVGEGPLHGATRRLLRRKVTVGDYPRLTPPAKLVTISSQGDRPGRGNARFVVTPTPLIAEDRDNLGFVADLLPEGNDGWKNRDPIRLGPVAVRDGEAIASIDLTKATPFDWSKAPVEARARLQLSAPWLSTPATCEVTIRREPYKLKVGADELVFDLSGPMATNTLPVALDSSLATSERVSVSCKPSEAASTLEVRGKGENRLRLTLEGGEEFVAPAGRDGEVQIRLKRPDGPVEAGEYTGKIFLRPGGDRAATVPAELKVRVLVYQPVVRIQLRPAPVPVTNIRLSMLAGSQTMVPMEVGLAGPDSQHEIVGLEYDRKIAPSPFTTRHSADPADRFPVRDGWFRPRGAGGRFELGVEVPMCVRDGRYTTELAFKVTARTARGETTYLVRRPVEVDVHRVAIAADAPLQSPGPAGERWLIPDRKSTGDQATLALELATPFTEKELVVRWRAEVVDNQVKPATPGKDTPDTHWLDLKEMTDGGVGQSVLGAEARTLPVSQVSAQRLVVVAQNLAELEPGVYRCTLRFHGEVENPKLPKPPVVAAAADPPHFDMPIAVLVPGRSLTVDRLQGADKVQAIVTSYGCPPGTGQLRSQDVPAPARDLTASGRPDPSGRPLVSTLSSEIAPGPGLSRFTIYWPRRPADTGLPAEQPSNPDPARYLSKEVRFWQKPRFQVDRPVAAAGDKIAVRLPLTLGTFDKLSRPVSVRVTHHSATVAEFQLAEDKAAQALTGAFELPVGAAPSAGDYTVALVRPLIPSEAAPAGTDERELTPDPVVVHLGLEVTRTDRPLGPLVYGGGFFSSDRVSDSSLIRLTNHTPHDMKYTVIVRYPSNRTVTAEHLIEEAKSDFIPALHLDVKPVTADGTIKPGASADIGVEVGLSADALDAYLNGREHPTLGSKTGAVVVVSVAGEGPDGKPFTWDLRQPIVVETQSWRSRGLWYAVVAILGSSLLGFYGYRRWRVWARKKAAAGPGGPGGVEDKTREETTASPPPPPDDDLPTGNVFGPPPA